MAGASRQFDLRTDPHPLELAVEPRRQLGLEFFFQKRFQILLSAVLVVVELEVLERAGIEVEEHDVVVVHAVERRVDGPVWKSTGASGAHPHCHAIEVASRRWR